MSSFNESGFAQLIGIAGYAVETAGVLIIISGSIWVTIRVFREYSPETREDQYRQYRRDLARAMILGLEFLVAGDIIRTVVVAHSVSDRGLGALRYPSRARSGLATLDRAGR